MTFDYTKHFPYDSPRKEQVTAIEFALNAFINEKKRFVVLDLATGIGKSGIAVAVARYMNEIASQNIVDDYIAGSYFITTQKMLQEQYTNDFGGHSGCMKSIKSSSNYSCKFFTKQSCGESLRMLKFEDKDSSFFKACIGGCIYKSFKQEFIESKESVTNFAYFLSETRYAGKLKPRNLLVVDEAHNAEEQLSKHIEMTFSEKFAKQMLRLNMPEKIETHKEALDWINNEYRPALKNHIANIERIIGEKKSIALKLNKLGDIYKQYEMLDKHICKIHRFLELYTKDNWVLNVIPAGDKSMRKLEFKPVDVSPYSHDTLFKLGKHILLMSATIVNKDGFCKSLGIDQSDVAFLHMPSPFPEKNRPIFYAPMGSMSKSMLGSTLPSVTKAVKEIMSAHPNEKGIIHTNTFQIAWHIKNALRDKRILIHNSENRELVIEKHKKSKQPTILISPSLTEGIDLTDDLSRFQIICKIPWPYLGDKVVRKRMKKHSWWYDYATAKTLIQAIGRSIRNENDFAVSYILDSDWDKFYSRARHLFPEDFDRLLNASKN